MTTKRQVTESPMRQGAGESIAYTLTTTPWGSSPGSVVCAVYDVTDNRKTDVTATVMPVNSPSAVGDVITLSPLKLLTAGRVYRVEVAFTCSGNVFEAYCIIEAEE